MQIQRQLHAANPPIGLPQPARRPLPLLQSAWSQRRATTVCPAPLLASTPSSCPPTRVPRCWRPGSCRRSLGCSPLTKVGRGVAGWVAARVGRAAMGQRRPHAVCWPTTSKLGSLRLPVQGLGSRALAHVRCFLHILVAACTGASPHHQHARLYCALPIWCSRHPALSAAAAAHHALKQLPDSPSTYPCWQRCTILFSPLTSPAHFPHHFPLACRICLALHFFPPPSLACCMRHVPQLSACIVV